LPVVDLKRDQSQMVSEFFNYWKNYVIQSILAIAAIFIVLLVLSLEHAVVIASIGSSVFVVFAMPNSVSSRPRSLIGGQLIGLLVGSIFGFFTLGSEISQMFAYSFAVGTSIFLMVVLDMEHPPAAGTALGVAITGYSNEAALALITSSILLSLIHQLFKPYLRDLV